VSCNSYEELARGERSLGREGERERGREGERERGREGERERGREGERERGREGERERYGHFIIARDSYTSIPVSWSMR